MTRLLEVNVCSGVCLSVYPQVVHVGGHYLDRFKLDHVGTRPLTTQGPPALPDIIKFAHLDFTIEGPPTRVQIYFLGPHHAGTPPPAPARKRAVGIWLKYFHVCSSPYFSFTQVLWALLLRSIFHHVLHISCCVPSPQRYLRTSTETVHVSCPKPETEQQIIVVKII